VLPAQTWGARVGTLSIVTTKTSPAKPAEKKATPWGAAMLLDEVVVPQRAGEKRFATSVQLLETEKGERLVRFSYSTGGVGRRGPVTLRRRDLERLRDALVDHPELAEAIAMT
jgi:hypothetical protein